MKELTDAYSIVAPCVKVFRRGIMAEYRGPSQASAIPNYLKQDSQVSKIDFKLTLTFANSLTILAFIAIREVCGHTR